MFLFDFIDQRTARFAKNKSSWNWKMWKITGTTWGILLHVTWWLSEKNYKNSFIEKKYKNMKSFMEKKNIYYLILM